MFDFFYISSGLYCLYLYTIVFSFESSENLLQGMQVETVLLPFTF